MSQIADLALLLMTMARVAFVLSIGLAVLVVTLLFLAAAAGASFIRPGMKRSTTVVEHRLPGGIVVTLGSSKSRNALFRTRRR